MVEKVAESKQKELSVTGTEAKKLKVGLIMPISHTEGFPIGHWGDVRKIIEEALKEITEYEVEVSMVSESEDVTLIQKTIIQRIYEDDIVIVDVSSKNPNVMFELGVRLAFDRPFILLKDDLTDYIFDISSIHHINYRRDLRYKDIVDVKNQIKSKLLATYKKSLEEESMYLKDFGTFKVANLQSTELPIKDYMEKMFSEIKRDINRVRHNIISINEDDEVSKHRKDTFAIDGLANRIIRGYIKENDVGDGSELFNESHPIYQKIKSSNIVKNSTVNDEMINRIIHMTLDDLGFLNF
ncbi:hypothetical protein [Lysinibacillus fusiformis]|uniref:RNA helicase n=1 Tax=Lysinibacillus fusiformis TaxID=28031 RepID=A0A2I0V1I1_9BACI|nr:hypothetical protein [Lysinibacillus fusiformis]PKU52173.1 hypothetical protein CRI88_07340 [Lysinibacillus fusiformis]